MFSGGYVQWNDLGGVVPGGGGGIVMGLIRRPVTVAVARGGRRRCTPADLFSRGGLGGAVADVAAGVWGGTRRFEGPRKWRKPKAEP